MLIQEELSKIILEKVKKNFEYNEIVEFININLSSHPLSDMISIQFPDIEIISEDTIYNEKSCRQYTAEASANIIAGITHKMGSLLSVVNSIPVELNKIEIYYIIYRTYGCFSFRIDYKKDSNSSDRITNHLLTKIFSVS